MRNHSVDEHIGWTGLASHMQLVT